MRPFFILAAFLSCLSLSATAKLTVKSNIVQTDTLKKGKNYILYSKTENIQNVSFSQNKKKDNLVVIRYGYPNPMAPTNTIGGAIQQSKSKYSEPEPVPVFDKIEIIKGKYETINVEKENDLRNRFTLSTLEFPLHLKLTSGKEVIELELQEASYWNISIELKK